MMNREQALLYLLEVGRQHEFAKISEAILRSALQRRDRDTNVSAFAGAQGILTSAAQISKLMWPSPLRRWSEERRSYAEQRGKFLREIVNPDPILKRREVRNSVEHFDDRLDDFFLEDTNSNPYSAYLGSRSLAPATPSKNAWLRQLDPSTLVFSYQDEEIDLNHVLAAIRDAADAVDRWIDGPSLTALLKEEAERVAGFEH